jgi:Flp pilus assembly protein CpaB
MKNLFYTLAATLAFGTAYYYYQDVSAQSATIQKLVFVSKDDQVFPAGTVIDDAFIEAHLQSRDVPAQMADQMTWAIGDTPATRTHLHGRVLAQDVPAGGFLQGAQFAVKRSKTLAERIKPGFRAFSVEVRGETAVETFVTPGSRVDVIGTFVARRDKEGSSRRLLENVVVMASGNFDTRGAFEQQKRPEYRTVTLQVPNEKIEDFLTAKAAANGGLTLVLRNPCEDVPSCVGTPILASLDGGNK